MLLRRGVCDTFNRRLSGICIDEVAAIDVDGWYGNYMIARQGSPSCRYFIGYVFSRFPYACRSRSTTCGSDLKKSFGKTSTADEKVGSTEGISKADDFDCTSDKDSEASDSFLGEGLCSDPNDRTYLSNRIKLFCLSLHQS